MNSRLHRNARPAILGLALSAIVLGPLSLWRAAGAGDSDPPIVEEMNKINSHYKIILREARRLSFTDETTKRVEEMVVAAAKAMHETPPMLGKESDPAKVQQEVIVFRKQMGDMLSELVKLEIALLEGRKEDAKTSIDRLGALKKEGHDRFVEE